MKVREIMSRSAITVSPNSSLHDVWKILYKKHVHGLPVVDSNKILIGIIAEEDILGHLFPRYDEFILDLSSHNFSDIEKKAKEISGVKAKDIMNINVHFVFDDEPIMRGLSKMMIYQVRQLPVINQSKKLVGMISRGDVFDLLFKKYLKNAA